MDGNPHVWETPSTRTRGQWPPDYIQVFGWRQQKIREFREDPSKLAAAKLYYTKNPVAFINHWVDTYDPRNVARKLPARIPFVMFEKQEEMVEFIYALIDGEADGLFEKCRDMGATWVCVAVSVHMWLFWPGASIGWGSRKEILVDKIGDYNSIFEKIRSVIKSIPPFFLPKGFNAKEHLSFMKVVNPENGSTITGEAGDDIGRGGRSLVYFKDESAHYARPDMIEAALGDNTRVQIDISSVNGEGNVFYRKRMAGKVYTKEDPKIVQDQTNVMLLDWRDHPEKDDEWYYKRRKKAEDAGLLAKFAQEVERDYAASVEGVLIAPEHVRAAIDAHKRLGLPRAEGRKIAGLDVADEGLDKNSYVERVSYLVKTHETWAKGDTGATARRAVTLAMGNAEINYDCIGVGAGVKAESNRMDEAGQLPAGVSFTPWSASDKVINPEKHMLNLDNGEPDKNSPKNKDFFQNLKAQAGWELARRFEKTYKAVVHGEKYEPEELISLPSDLPGLQILVSELSQPTFSHSAATGKMVINKKPEGKKSPNSFDSLAMAFWNKSDAIKKKAKVFIRNHRR